MAKQLKLYTIDDRIVVKTLCLKSDNYKQYPQCIHRNKGEFNDERLCLCSEIILYMNGDKSVYLGLASELEIRLNLCLCEFNLKSNNCFKMK